MAIIGARARDFGTRVVATETPLSGGDEGQALERLREAPRELIPLAEDSGALLCIEPVWGHAVPTPRAMAELLEEAGSESLGAILDPVSLVDPRCTSRISSFAVGPNSPPSRAAGSWTGG